MSIQTHNTKHPLYAIWNAMKQRCKNPNHPYYKNYGGRGIKVCPEWSTSFLTFVNDIGPKPSAEYSIDRIDNNGDYKPGNVRWATSFEQMRNSRNFRGGRRTIIEMEQKQRKIARMIRRTEQMLLEYEQLKRGAQ